MVRDLHRDIAQQSLAALVHGHTTENDMATNTQNISHHANQLLPDSFEPGTIFATYDGIVPLSRDCESFTIVAWDVPGGRRFRAELSDIECELVSEPEFRAFALAASMFRRCVAQWTKIVPLHRGSGTEPAYSR